VSVPRAPDYDVVIGREFTGRDGKTKKKYFKIGVAWINDDNINFEMYTMPNVILKMFPCDNDRRQPEKKEDKCPSS
jgi:hypothetical protein